MKVYVVWEQFTVGITHGRARIIAVYSTKKKARARADVRGYFVTEVTVDEDDD